MSDIFGDFMLKEAVTVQHELMATKERLAQAHALISHAVHKMHLRCDENREWLDKACDWLGEPHLDTK